MASIEKLPSGSYRVVFRINGQKSSRSFRTRADAREFAQRLDDRGDSGAPRYDEWCVRWFAEHRTTVKASTGERYKKMLNLHVIPEIGMVPLDILTPSILRKWQADKLGTHAPATVKLARSIATMCLDVAVIDGIIASNPFKRVPAIKLRKKKIRIISEQEITALADVMDERFRVMVFLAGYCGLRIGEMCALRRDDLDLIERKVTIDLTRTKAEGKWFDDDAKTENSKRILAVPKFVMLELEHHIREGFASDERVLTGRRKRGPLQPDYFRKFPWAKALEAAGLGKLRVHDLRHTAVSIWIREGASPNLVAYRAGHSSVQYVFDTYGHLFGDEDEGLADKLDAGRPLI